MVKPGILYFFGLLKAKYLHMYGTNSLVQLLTYLHIHHYHSPSCVCVHLINIRKNRPLLTFFGLFPLLKEISFSLQAKFPMFISKLLTFSLSEQIMYSGAFRIFFPKKNSCPAKNEVMWVVRVNKNSQGAATQQNYELNLSIIPFRATEATKRSQRLSW